MKVKRPLTPEQFKDIYSKVPRLTVELILDDERGVLLTKRSIPPYIGSWHIPGGTVFYKETLEDAVQRVAKEELGIEVEILKHLGFIHYPNLIEYQGWDWPIGSAFLIKEVGGELRGSEQGEELAFFKEIPVEIVPMQGEFLESIKKNALHIVQGINNIS